ncbi:site-specific integrase [Nonomuraea sp. H19]|uniref:site-specific integrase n=1 Tax=Nonomuraea sp. H19 TaxID=3452206 RepID=UPI003F897EEB
MVGAHGLCDGTAYGARPGVPPPSGTGPQAACPDGGRGEGRGYGGAPRRRLGKVSFKEYGTAWIDERAGLRPKTVQLYEGLLRIHLVPTFGNCAMSEIKVAHIRKWRKQLLDGGVGPVTVAKAYRLLKAIFNTALEDGLIKSNPCTIKKAGKEDSPERPVLTMKQVFTLADAIEPRFRMLILLATFASLRWGELAALQRKNVDLKAGTIRVVGTTTELKDGSVTIGPPKSEAGKRIVSIPATLLSDLRVHGDVRRTGRARTRLRRPQGCQAPAREFHPRLDGRAQESEA